MRPAKPTSIRFQIAVFSITHTVLNTGYRMIYPFLPALSRGLGVDYSVLAMAVTVRSLLGLGSPLLGRLADTRGRKTSLLLGVSIFSVAFAIVSFWPTLPGLFTAIILSMAGKIIFGPAVQAFLGDHVDYGQRGTAIAITELGWSTANLIGIPLVGFVIARWGWQAPFPLLAVLGLLAILVIQRVIPRDTIPTQIRPSLLLVLHKIIDNRLALAAIWIGSLISAGNEVVNIVYGVWMEQSLQIDVAALGVASAIIGLAELSGEGSVAIHTDRIGKRNSVVLGILVNAGACCALPLLGRNLTGALAGLFLLYLSFEFTLVSIIPLMSELVPTARAMSISLLVAGFAAGRGIGALAGPALFGIGMMANCGLAVILDIIALATMLFFVRG
jgi:predicted MFS family arabinose efflux permease